ncbi:superinfection immunity protein [Pseudomonas alloputida]|uniref:Superinfection immunity protein n=2 Tax=Pseudomonas TaxID=286 RepID=A0AAW7HXC1_9PSED|nr:MULTISPECIES: superinfection immunity protein [Pseudomonas]QEQ87178.1 superinfection immunity protein [Pseudomonas putida]MCE0865580.1 superinfection immunity protein [Pseudomonas alloputida]MCE0869268.1 superinfection immunity protein [Pseudomonas alloputida]MCE0894471.1 superinfection immunity protein [Pseudomonas alloputida]MCE0923746.1 superinfection immunity protein [Pseudomonas alloputida]
MVVEPESTKAFVTLALVVAVYFIPTIVAAIRLHQNRVSIMLLNLFLGWTGLGWLGALIWSASAINKPAGGVAPPIAHAGRSGEDPYHELEKLAALKERGHITAEEFEAEKAKILSR